VAVRLAELGFTVPSLPNLPEGFEHDDLTLLSRDLDGASPWLDQGKSISRARLAVAAAALGRQPAEVAARFAELGFIVNDAEFAERFDQDDIILLSSGSGDVESTDIEFDEDEVRWLDPDSIVSLAIIISVSIETGWSIAEVGGRLIELGFNVPDLAGLPERLDGNDRILISANLNGRAPFLDREHAVPYAFMAAAAAMLGKSASWVASRLASLGFAIPDLAGTPSRLDRDDLVLLSRDLDRAWPWISYEKSISRARLTLASAALGRSPAEIAVRFAELGFTTPSPEGLPERLDGDDLTILKRDLTRRGFWLDPDEPISYAYLVAAAKTRRSPAELARRLTQLGFILPVGLGLGGQAATAG
jgi:hypothetical protein